MSYIPSTIAEEPFDPLGQEYFDTFTGFITNNSLSQYSATRTSPVNIRAIALDVFFLRYSLALKYNTMFAKQMVDGGVLYWKRRFEGRSSSYSFSWAVKGHPRSGELWRMLDISYNRRNCASQETYYFGDPGSPMAPEFPLTGNHQVNTWSRQVSTSLNLWCHIFRPTHNQQFFLIRHVSDADVPDMLDMCNHYMNMARDKSRSLVDRIESLARMEYMWFWTNPFGRAGAISGDAISFLVQKEMVEQGHRFHGRKNYMHLDYYAFGESMDSFVEWRHRTFFELSAAVA
jgi:hypothetical protein